MRGYIKNQSTEHYKRYSTSGRPAFYDQLLLSYGSFSLTSSAFVEKKENINLRRFLKIFCQKTSFHNLLKVPKNTVPNTMAIDLS